MSFLSSSRSCFDPRPFDRAFEEARLAGERGEVPVGAVVLLEGNRILSAAGNAMCAEKDPTAHAEIRALRIARTLLGTPYLSACDLYVTLEPCTLCAAAISLTRIRRLYFAAEDPKSGGVLHGVRFYSTVTCHHAPEVYAGFREEEARTLLQTFFKERRMRSKEASVLKTPPLPL